MIQIKTKARSKSALGQWLAVVKIGAIQDFIKTRQDENHSFPSPELPVRKEITPTKIHTHNVLNTFLQWLPLGDALRWRLNREGVSDEVIERLHIRETPSEIFNIVLSAELGKKFDLRNIPGFTRTALSGWRLDIEARSWGLIAAERDASGRIRFLRMFRSLSDCGFRIRTRGAK